MNTFTVTLVLFLLSVFSVLDSVSISFAQWDSGYGLQAAPDGPLSHTPSHDLYGRPSWDVPVRPSSPEPSYGLQSSPDSTFDNSVSKDIYGRPHYDTAPPSSSSRQGGAMT